MKNTGITLVDVREEAMDAIAQIKAGKLDLKSAHAIRDLLGVVVDTAKTQVEFLKSLPGSVKEQLSADNVKAIAGTLRDRDAELDQSLHEIEQNERDYTFGGNQ